MKTKKMAVLALFTTIALTIFILESAIPPLVPINGVKLGLANIVTLFIMVKYNNKDAIIVLLARIFLSSVFAGQMMSFIFSLIGGILCFVAMCIVNKLLQKKYLYITSVIGAIFHNIGQLIAATLIVQSLSVLVNIPILLISAIITGLFTGFCTHFAVLRLKNIN